MSAEPFVVGGGTAGALAAATFPDVVDLVCLREVVVHRRERRPGALREPRNDGELDVPVDEHGAAVDRKRYGEDAPPLRVVSRGAIVGLSHTGDLS